MKTTFKIIITLIIVAIFSTSNLYAGGDNTQVKFGKVLKKYVPYPDFAKEQKLEGSVVVCFSLTENGSIQLNATDGSDEALKAYVNEKLKDLKLDAKENQIVLNNTEEKYYVRFVFKMEDDFKE